MLLGTLVLLPFSLVLRQSKMCGPLLSADCIDFYHRWPKEWEGLEGLVVLTEIFVHELSHSYIRPWRRVLSYIGIKVKSLYDLQHLWDESCSQVQSLSQEAVKGTKNNNKIDDKSEDIGNSKQFSFVRLGLENDDDIVFEVEAAMKAQTEVMEIHSISNPCNIVPANPKYI